MAKAGLEFGGVEQFAAPPARLYGLLTDLNQMAGSIPDLVSAEQVDPTTMKCVVRPGFSFLRGTMRLTITLGECHPVSDAAMRVAAQGIGLGMEIASALHVVPEGAGSRLEWSAQVVELKGLISAVSPALIRGAADQVIRHAWASLRRQLGEAAS